VPGYYELTEEFGETKINFIGQPIQNPSDINTTEVPYGGVIVSVGSTDGFGYQPLVSAGGTAIVSVAGTISQISIGNSGSGYRIGIQTQVNVGVKTYSAGIPNIEFVGTAVVSGGNVVSVNIANSGAGYTSSNPPEVVFDDPIGYTNIPLIYSSQSQSGIGTQATIDIVVGKGTNIINFNINNFGYGYNVGDILTISTSENVGIPTISNNNLFTEFQISVDETYNVDFSGWSMGQFQVLDNLDSRFNGRNKNFQISFKGAPISISKKRGSPIELEYVLLIFINDILQIPIKDYTFSGSILRFNSAPKGSSANPPFKGDTSKIIFYKGTEGIDVNFVEILDSPKIGDLLTIGSDFKRLSQKSRIIELISSIDTADTNKYSDFGISEDENLLRPVTWCKQTEDLYIFGKEVTKDRKIYNPYINPVSYLIKNLNDNDTEIFVDSAKLSFDYSKENISSDKLNIIEIISNSENVGEYENISNVQSIEGDFGLIVGIGSTSIVGVSDTCLTFDLFIPQDSFLRDTQLNDGISTEGISGIQTAYRFVVSGTTDGSSNLSFDNTGNPISVGTTFLDNIYECFDFNNQTTFLAGIGFTNITRAVVPVNHYDNIEFINPLGFIEDFGYIGGTENIFEANSSYNVMPVDGSGLGASFNIQRNSIGHIISISSNDGGFGYNVGDQLTIPGNLIGGGGQISSISYVGTSVDYSEEYFGVGGTTSGSGVDAEFDIERDSFGEINSIEVINKGSSYSKNDTIIILGSSVGGEDIGDDIIITVENTEIKSIDFIGIGTGIEGFYIGVGGTTSGNGFSAEFNVEIDEFGEINSLQITNTGTDYEINDTITILGSDIGGDDIDDDIIITITDTQIKSISFAASIIEPIKIFNSIQGTTSGSGLSAKFDIERNEFGEIISVDIIDQGLRYEINDTILVLGSNVGGKDGIDDITITVEDITDLDLILINVIDISIPDKFEFGKYSWGRITVPFRSSPKSFDINFPAISGISTNPIIRRKNSLKTNLYST
jgi:hypothetical protein